MTCPVCIWPWRPNKPDEARYGGPSREDERSLSDSPYLHALSDVIMTSTALVVNDLCLTHHRELEEINKFVATGEHPKKNAELLAAERRVVKAQEEWAAANDALRDLSRKKP